MPADLVWRRLYRLVVPVIFSSVIFSFDPDLTSSAPIRHRRSPVTRDTQADLPTAGQQAEVYQAQRQEKPWGHEQIFAAEDGKYVGKIIYVNAGQSLSLQYHEHK